ncbi:MAG: ribulose-phosphate 3-epimerase [Candidatus Eremiobacteraeota bacterium]|nr:ribulose-phosphate 3-epimerase [Candidatus Eremiobacteraeota bacterium]MBC5826480.1 ribulose-phosphate 3-epimerase [Candidatus Eremiobacteraeota bacterium]
MNDGGPKIAPSLLSADFAFIREQIALVEEAGADYLHIDVMDGRFVPNITWGPKIVRDLRPLSKLPLDVHLMIVEPERYVDRFIEAGAQLVSVHWEATVHAHRLMEQIRSKGARAGLAINPATSLDVLPEILPYVDVLLVMSVNPGFGGQKYIPTSTAKVAGARRLLEQRGLDVEIEVDGGVTLTNVAEVVRAGADTVVMGAGIYETASPAQTIRQVRKACAR